MPKSSSIFLIEPWWRTNAITKAWSSGASWSRGDSSIWPSIARLHVGQARRVILKGVVIPIGRASEDRKNQADFHHKMKLKHLASSRFDDEYKLSDGSVLSCPLTWR